MIHLVTFASEDYSRSARLCVESAMRTGVNEYDVINQQAVAHWPVAHGIRLSERGAGYWAWKPLVIDDALNNWVGISEGDILIYSDAGVEFIEPVQLVIDRMDQDVFLFGNEHEHAHWCKRDIINAVWSPQYALQHGQGRAAKRVIVEDDGLAWSNFGKQAQASVIFLRVNDYTRKFVKEWLDWCLFEGGRLIDDSPSRTPNHPEFKENRHDQAILTTLAYREGIKLHEWYVKYEGYTPGRMSSYQQEFERPLFFHHRRRNHEWEGIAA